MVINSLTFSQEGGRGPQILNFDFFSFIFNFLSGGFSFEVKKGSKGALERADWGPLRRCSVPSFAVKCLHSLRGSEGERCV